MTLKNCHSNRKFLDFFPEYLRLKQKPFNHTQPIPGGEAV